MSIFSKEPDEIRQFISTFENDLMTEFESTGNYEDAHGKRYLLAPLYLIINDMEGVKRNLIWFDETFHGDIGEPTQYISYILALIKLEDLDNARKCTVRTLFVNPYIIPFLLGKELDKLEIWYSSNYEEPEYAEGTPPEIIELWDDESIKWLAEVWESSELSELREDYIALLEEMELEEDMDKRKSIAEKIKKMKEIYF